MQNQISHWLANVPASGPVARRQATVFQSFLIGWIALAAVGVPVLNLQPSSGAPGPSAGPSGLILGLLLIAGALLLICPVCALVVLRRGHFQGAVAVATFGLLLSHSLATFLLGIESAATLIVFQIPIALAGLLAGRRLLLIVAGLSIGVVVLVGFLESLSPPLAGLFTIALNSAGQGSAALPSNQATGILIGFFIAVTALVTLLLDRFGNALREALATSLAREEELHGIRASLEESVAERTAALQTALAEVQARAEEQAHLLAEIEHQRMTIQDLSVPVIPIDAATLVMPLVGGLDSTRLHQIQEQGLRALERTSARTLVLDITGVPIVDTQVAQGLLMTVRAGRLLGAEVALVGIRPEVAQALVGLGLELRDVKTFSDLQSALNHSAHPVP
jgi:rsbT co-antagonist protein RsbR